jgi:hypothetical protein
MHAAALHFLRADRRRRALGLREKFIAKRRNVRIVDRRFGKPPRFLVGQSARVLWVKPVNHAGYVGDSHSNAIVLAQQT